MSSYFRMHQESFQVCERRCVRDVILRAIKRLVEATCRSSALFQSVDSSTRQHPSCDRGTWYHPHDALATSCDPFSVSLPLPQCLVFVSHAKMRVLVLWCFLTDHLQSIDGTEVRPPHVFLRIVLRSWFSEPFVYRLVPPKPLETRSTPPLLILLLPPTPLPWPPPPSPLVLALWEAARARSVPVEVSSVVDACALLVFWCRFPRRPRHLVEQLQVDRPPCVGIALDLVSPVGVRAQLSFVRESRPCHSPSNHVSSSLFCGASGRLHATASPISTTRYATFFWCVFSHAVSALTWNRLYRHAACRGSHVKNAESSLIFVLRRVSTASMNALNCCRTVCTVLSAPPVACELYLHLLTYSIPESLGPFSHR